MTTPNDLQNLVIASLSDADPSALASLQTNVPLYWQLFARVPLPELRYWYVRRESVKLLMACLTQQIDYLRRNQNSTRTSFNNSLQNASSSASSVSDDSAHSDRNSSSQYDDATDASGSGSSTAARNGAQAAQDDMSYVDVGQGSSSASRTSTLTATTNIDDSMSDRNNWTIDGNRNASSAKNDHSGEIQSGIGGSITIFGITGAKSDTTTNTARHNDYTLNDISSDTRTTSYTMTQSDDHLAQSSQPSSQSSSSSFTNDITQSDVATSSSSMTGSASSSSTYNMAGSGTGTSSMTASSASQMDASASRSASASGETHSGMSATMQNNSLMEKLHQRFLHLQQLWEQATAMIEWWEKQRLGVAPYILQAITIQYPEGCQADIANAFLVQTPTKPIRVMGVRW